jgi:hypothetical protein
MSNVLDHQKQQQVLGLGRLGWAVRRIAKATGVDRAAARGYLLAAGIPVRGRGRPGERAAKAAISVEVSTDCTQAKPAVAGTVFPDAVSSAPARAPSASACEPYRELIAEALGHGRNAMAIWQDLVDDHGFAARYASVRRFVLTLSGTPAVEARVVIISRPGEDYGETGVMVSVSGSMTILRRFHP